MNSKRQIPSWQNHRSLEEIEGDRWGPPTYTSKLVQQVHALREKPLRDLTPNDVRIAISQKIGISHLLPLALHLIEEKPALETAYYPGDLLKTVVEIPQYFWEKFPDELARLEKISLAVIAQSRISNPFDLDAISIETIAVLERFCSTHRST